MNSAASRDSTSAGGLAGGFAVAAALLDQQVADLVALLVLQVFQVQLDVESLPRPGGQPLAVVALVAAGVAGGEVVQPGHHRVLDLLFVVGRLGPLADQRLERRRLQVGHFLGRQRDAELVLHPAAGRPQAEVGLQERRAVGEVHLADAPRGPSR